MQTRTLLSPSPSINQQVLEQCKTICESKTFNKAEEAQQKKTGATHKTKVEKARLSNSEANRRLLELLVKAWVNGERLTDMRIRERWNLRNMDPANSDMRKRKQQLRRALETYYLGTQYVEAQGEADSIEIGLGHGFKIDVWSRKDVPQQMSDVLATYKGIPASDICTRINSANCAHIRVWITGLVEFNRWIKMLANAQKRTVTMEFMLSHPKSEFLEQRETACKDIQSIVTSNRESIKQIVHTAKEKLPDGQQPTTQLGKCTLKWTSGWIPLPYIQIDDVIYAGVFWRDRAVADGSFFLLDASSPTGDFLTQEFLDVWKTTAMEDSLQGNDIPPMR